MQIRVRKGGRADIDGLSTLLTGLFSIETDFTVDPEKQKTGLALFLDGRDGKAIFVAEADGILVGMVTCQLVISTAAGGVSVLLEDMYVLDAFRRRRIGTALIRQVQDWCAEQGALRIQLVADERNGTALAFYRGSDFQESRMRGLYATLNG
jgi:GNAT superfamily N-acetyltransferase